MEDHVLFPGGSSSFDIRHHVQTGFWTSTNSTYTVEYFLADKMPKRYVNHFYLLPRIWVAFYLHSTQQIGSTDNNYDFTVEVFCSNLGRVTDYSEIFEVLLSRYAQMTGE
jgi:hypothetical protein